MEYLTNPRPQDGAIHQALGSPLLYLCNPREFVLFAGSPLPATESSPRLVIAQFPPFPPVKITLLYPRANRARLGRFELFC